jgi:hypothetical protein
MMVVGFVCLMLCYRLVELDACLLLRFVSGCKGIGYVGRNLAVKMFFASFAAWQQTFLTDTCGL